MPQFSHYGSGQRVGFVLVFVGFCLCFSGSIAPYWITAKSSVNDLKVLEDIPGLDNIGQDITLFEVNVGVWYYCVEAFTQKKCYGGYDTGDYNGPGSEELRNRYAWINVVRGLVVLNVFLSCVAGLAACCRTLCCNGGRTIFHGVLSFIAGVLGLSAVVLFYDHSDSLLNIPIVNVDFDWAYGLYCVGSIMMVVASILLCFARPREVPYGVVMAPQPTGPGVSVNVTNTNVSQYNAGPPVQAFEPLPHPANLYNRAAAPGDRPMHPYSNYPATGPSYKV